MEGQSEQDPVGYKRTPKSTRFQKGRSGNPRGRPRNRRRDLMRHLVKRMIERRDRGDQRHGFTQREDLSRFASCSDVA